jgi:hypothetical protein
MDLEDLVDIAMPRASTLVGSLGALLLAPFSVFFTNLFWQLPDAEEDALERDDHAAWPQQWCN